LAKQYGPLLRAVNLPQEFTRSRSGGPAAAAGAGRRAPALASIGASADIYAVDLFAGGGGASTAVEWATGASPRVAINHCEHAVAIHTQNHPEPDTRHYCQSVQLIDPGEVCSDRDTIDLLWLSPDCTHFSSLRGGKPVDRRIRALAWEVLRWIDAKRPRVIFLENVSEFQGWGPVGPDNQPIKSRSGETFRAFIGALRNAGYSVDWRQLDASHFGAPTQRKRLFLVARSDGQPITWPAPTHGPGRTPRVSAFQCIDWNKPIETIFAPRQSAAAARRGDAPHYPSNPSITSGNLANPLAMRIAYGVQRFVGRNEPPHPMQAQGRKRTIPFLITDGYGEHGKQKPRVLNIHEPLGTIVAGGSKHGIVQITLGTEPNLEVARFLRKHAYQPKRYGSAYPTIKRQGRTWYVVDIGYRKMDAADYLACMGLPEGYVITGTQTQQIARIGNMVNPQIAAALISHQVKQREAEGHRRRSYNPRWTWRKVARGDEARWLGKTATTRRTDVGATIERMGAVRALPDGLYEWSLVVKVTYAGRRAPRTRRWTALVDDVTAAKAAVERTNRGVGALGA